MTFIKDAIIEWNCSLQKKEYIEFNRLVFIHTKRKQHHYEQRHMKQRSLYIPLDFVDI
jgi:hypothetical protein